MIKLPINGQWKVDNSSDILGQFNFAQGVHFDDNGYLSVSSKPISIYSSSDNANFGRMLKSLYYNSGYIVLTVPDIWTITSGLVFTNITDTEPSAPTVDAYSDAVSWQNRIYVSTGTATDVRYWDGSAWTDSTIAIDTDNVPHPMVVLGGSGLLALGNNNTVKIYNGSHILQATLTLDKEYVVTSLVYKGNYIYIGTQALYGGQAKVFLWNGTGTSSQAEYGVGSNRVFAMTEYLSSFALVTNEGEILAWNGGGFNQLATFPVYNSPYRWDNRTTTLIGKVLMNGMVADGQRLYINIDGNVGATFKLGSTTTENTFPLPDQPSGVWCYDPNVGLYCREPHTKDSYTSFTASALASNVLTLSANTNITTGDPIYVKENGSLTGVSDNTLYYAIKVTDNQISIANTRADAIAGTAITLGGAVTSAVILIANYTQNGDTYQHTSQGAGGIGLIQEDSSSTLVFPDIFKSEYMWGLNDGSVTRLNVSSSIPNIGFIRTIKIMAGGVKDTWQKLYVFLQDFVADNDKVIVRYKTKERTSLPTPFFTVTYSSDKVIGSSNTLMDLAEVGDSVHIVSGNGAGNIRTIEAINGDEITFTEALTGVSSGDTITIYIDSWKEAQRFTKDSVKVDEGFVESTLGFDGAWLKILLEIRGKMKIPEMRIVNKPHKETN